ncbi:MAG: hypothetical protein IJ368_07250 [Oscillospiraceae bacterium]|nr:hypothetical protein [Oscillospiraceae bacterium]
MEMRSLKATVRHQLFALRGIPIAVIVMPLLMLILGIIVNFIEFGEITIKGIYIEGFDGAFCFVFYIFAAEKAKDFYNTAAANGGSRKTALLCSTASGFVLSLLIAVMFSLIIPFWAFISQTQAGYDAEHIYGSISETAVWGSGAAAVFMMFAVMTARLFCAYMVGIFCGTLEYRMPKNVFIGLILLAAGLFIYATVLAGIDKNSFAARVLIAVVDVYDTIIGAGGDDPIRGVLGYTGIAVVLGAISWPVVCRSSVKPLPIRG